MQTPEDKRKSTLKNAYIRVITTTTMFFCMFRGIDIQHYSYATVCGVIMCLYGYFSYCSYKELLK